MIDINEHILGYTIQLADAMSKVDRSKMSRLYNALEAIVEAGMPVYVCGNGGSAAIAQHFACDHAKGVHGDCDHFHPNIISLSTNVPMITAIGNDIDFSEVFAHQLNFVPEKEGVLIAISSSGNSPNIIKAIKKAEQRGLATISFTGFDGGEAAKIADLNIHVPAHNYGIVEDIHQMLMHCLAQTLRMNNTKKPLETLKL